MLDCEYILLDVLKSVCQSSPFRTNLALTKEEMQNLIILADKHSVLALIYTRLLEAFPHLDSVIRPFELHVKKKCSEQLLRTAGFLDIYRKLINGGVKPLVLKGLILRLLYESPDSRSSCDEDILVSENDFIKAHILLTELGMDPIFSGKKIEDCNDISYTKKGTPLYIELHKSLFMPNDPVLKPNDCDFKDVFDNPSKIICSGVSVYTLSATNHLIYIILHALKHFLYSGVGIRHVCDIALFSKKYFDEIDWITVKNILIKYKAEYFTASIYKIAEKYFGINIPDIFESCECDEEPLLCDMLSGGVLGNSNISRLRSGALSSKTARGNGSGTSILKSVFPSADKLKSEYKYLNKYPILLPTAWFLRLINYRKETKSSGEKPTESIKIAKERTELFRQYKII